MATYMLILLILSFLYDTNDTAEFWIIAGPAISSTTPIYEYLLPYEIDIQPTSEMSGPRLNINAVCDYVTYNQHTQKFECNKLETNQYEAPIPIIDSLKDKQSGHVLSETAIIHLTETIATVIIPPHPSTDLENVWIAPIQEHDPEIMQPIQPIKMIVSESYIAENHAFSARQNLYQPLLTLLYNKVSPQNQMVFLNNFKHSYLFQRVLFHEVKNKNEIIELVDNEGWREYNGLIMFDKGILVQTDPSRLHSYLPLFLHNIHLLVKPETNNDDWQYRKNDYYKLTNIFLDSLGETALPPRPMYKQPLDAFEILAEMEPFEYPPLRWHGAGFEPSKSHTLFTYKLPKGPGVQCGELYLMGVAHGHDLNGIIERAAEINPNVLILEYDYFRYFAGLTNYDFVVDNKKDFNAEDLSNLDIYSRIAMEHDEMHQLWFHFVKTQTRIIFADFPETHYIPWSFLMHDLWKDPNDHYDFYTGIELNFRNHIIAAVTDKYHRILEREGSIKCPKHLLVVGLDHMNIQNVAYPSENNIFGLAHLFTSDYQHIEPVIRRKTDHNGYYLEFVQYPIPHHEEQSHNKPQPETVDSHSGIYDDYKTYRNYEYGPSRYFKNVYPSYGEHIADIILILIISCFIWCCMYFCGIGTGCIVIAVKQKCDKYHKKEYVHCNKYDRVGNQL